MEPNAIEILRAAAALVEPYPPGVLPIQSPIPGTAFFPGGDGLYKERGAVEFPYEGVMVLGHNFDSEKGYTDSLNRGKEKLQGATWGRTLMLLQSSGVDPRFVFYTNFFMGVIEGDRAMGPFPGAEDKDFVRRCQQFLQLQIALMRPRLIITYGLHIPALIAPLSPDLEPWKNVKSIMDLDCAAIIHNVRFGAETKTTTLVGLLHPSMAGSNLRHREGYQFYEDSVEEMLLMDAVCVMVNKKDRPKPEWAKPYMNWADAFRERKDQGPA